MATTAAEVIEALKEAGLRRQFDAIDDNPATPGEVVLWAGHGTPVYSVEQALRIARERNEPQYDEDDE